MQVLGMLLVKLNQPRVIAEVIGGILLGPTFLGRIPGFTETLFPPESLISLKNTATLGLVL
jgi:Kef-type K+ transport system membrane component KefB